MGAVNTTYTFTATDTITSTKMNNIIDQTTMTSDAIIGTTLEVASGKLKVRAQGITSNEMATGSVTSNAILDGTIVNADINASAAIAGTKISPNFGSQNIGTTGTLASGNATLGSVFLSRENSIDEGGDLRFAKAIDNTLGFRIDCYGSTSSPDLRFISGSTVKAKMAQSGNLGIGGDFSASSPLEVRASTTDNSPINNGIRVFNAGTASDDNAVLAVHTSGASGGDPLVSWDINGVDGFCAGIDNSDNDKFKIASNWNDVNVDTRITIQQDGNVGIGTTIPSSKLDILDSAGTSGFALRVKTDGVANDSGIWTDSSNNVYFDARNGAGNLNASIRSSGNSFLTGGNLGLGTASPNSILHTYANQEVAQFESSTNNANIQIITNEGANNRVEIANRPGGRMVFGNNGSGDVVSILQNGNVGIKRPNPSAALDVNGTVVATAFFTSSDYRLKKECVTLSDGLVKVNALKPTNFKWIEGGTSVNGFIAHEVQAIVPDAIIGEKDAIDLDGNPIYQKIDQLQLIPILVAAIQELSQKVAELEAK